MAYPESMMGGMQVGTPPIIPGLTQLSPERMRAVMESQGPPMTEDEEEGMVDVKARLPRLIAAQFSLIQQAAEMGPEALEMLTTMATAAFRQLKRQVGPMSPPTYSSSPQGGRDLFNQQPNGPPMATPGVPGENPAMPFLSMLAAGGQP